MQSFSTQPQAPKENYFLSQPHQPFFIAGLIWAVVSMVIFMLSYKLMLKGDAHTLLAPSFFHAYSLIFIVFTQFFIGFLYTTFSRFCHSEPVKKPYYIRTFFLYQLGSILVSIGLFTSHTLMMAGMGVLFLAQAVFLYMMQRIFTSAQAEIKDDPFWILTSLYIGTTAHGLFIAETLLGWNYFSIPFAFNLYLVFLTFSVAQRMVPFFSHSLAQKRSGFVPTVFFALIIISTADILNKEIIKSIVSLLLGLYILFEVFRWQLSFSQAPNILKILHIALFWMPISLILGSFFTLAEIILHTGFAFADIHMLALGFLTTIIIGFGTRVTLGHSGQPPHADKTTLMLFYLTQIVVLVRLAYSLIFGFNLPMLWVFDISLSLWLILFIFWGWKFAPVLIRGKKEA